MKRLCGASAVLLATSSAGAAINPGWRINPITPVLINQSGGLLNSNSVSVTLQIELTNGSLFNEAALDLTSFENGPALLPGALIFNRSGGGATNNGTDYPEYLLPGGIFTIDTVITTPTRVPAEVVRRLNGAGTEQIGTPPIQTTGTNRTSQFFNVAWAAVPNNGSNGVFDIAVITFASGIVRGGSTPITLSKGYAAHSLNPSIDVPLPPIPVGAIPEPSSTLACSVGAGLLLKRRCRRT